MVVEFVWPNATRPMVEVPANNQLVDVLLKENTKMHHTNLVLLVTFEFQRRQVVPDSIRTWKSSRGIIIMISLNKSRATKESQNI